MKGMHKSEYPTHSAIDIACLVVKRQLFTDLLADPGAVIFNGLESIRIGGNLNANDEIVDYFYGIVAGKSVQLQFVEITY